MSPSIHKLLIYQELSRRMRGKLLWLGIVLTGLGGFDLLVKPVFAEFWFAVWIAAAGVWLMWIYYAFLARRAALYVLPDVLVLQGPLRRIKISYGRIETATSTKMAKHFPRNELNGQEWAMVAPYHHLTCIFLELNSFPRAFNHRRLWFPRILFSPMRPGLLLVVPDWMSLSRAIDNARGAWSEARRSEREGDKRSLAAQVLDY